MNILSNILTPNNSDYGYNNNNDNNDDNNDDDDDGSDGDIPSYSNIGILDKV